jgi:hypothetical protein
MCVVRRFFCICQCNNWVLPDICPHPLNLLLATPENFKRGSSHLPRSVRVPAWLYLSSGRCLLLGDAAHATSPVQTFTTSFDATFQGKKITSFLVTKGWIHESSNDFKLCNTPTLIVQRKTYLDNIFSSNCPLVSRW